MASSWGLFHGRKATGDSGARDPPVTAGATTAQANLWFDTQRRHAQKGRTSSSFGPKNKTMEEAAPATASEQANNTQPNLNEQELGTTLLT
jgi:hypothetical protein